MRNTIGLGLTFAAAGFFAIAPALAQSGSTSSSSSQSGTQGSQSGTRGSQSGTQGSQQHGTSSTGSHSGQSSGTSSGQYGQAGQSTTQSSTQSSSGISSSDRQFLTKAAQGSMAEVEMGKLAQERGSSEHVKELGKQLAEDHQKSLDQIRTIAQSKGIDLPQEVSKKDKAEHDRLSGLSGDAFDRAFLKAAQQDHRKDIAEYKRQAERSKDPEIQQYAQSTLPVLERHQQMSMQGSSTASTTEGATSTPRTDTEESATGSKQKDKDKTKDKEWSEERPKSSSSGSTSSGSGTNPK
ncbi:MAG TPA: DUF4142 domain-containing protein [Bryobacteraceae bacterium]|nr:DUF4142 domain-containing protein [Bryobacteraceae bacterium]